MLQTNFACAHEVSYRLIKFDFPRSCSLFGSCKAWAPTNNKHSMYYLTRIPHFQTTTLTINKNTSIYKYSLRNIITAAVLGTRSELNLFGHVPGLPTNVYVAFFYCHEFKA